MSGPRDQRTIEMPIPTGMSQIELGPQNTAWEIVNFERVPGGFGVGGAATLRSVTGPCPYEPYRSGEAPTPYGEEPHAVFHAALRGGIADTLLFRAGSVLYRHNGATRGWTSLKTGLSSERRPAYPDCFVVLRDQIIWTNGVDRALVITWNDMVVPLGFDQSPSAPTAHGPAPLTEDSRQNNYPNMEGYSWQGRIGTPGGMLDGTQGALLAGSWLYHTRYEDIHGNLSPASPASNPVSVAQLLADPFTAGTKPGGTDTIGFRYPYGDTHNGTEVDDLTRQFAVEAGDDGPDHCVAVHVYRTPDQRNKGGPPGLLARLPGPRRVIFPDTLSDAELGPEMEDSVAVPVFRLATEHQGCLVIANTPGDPGIVRRSEPGFPGTFPKDDFVYPDSGGAEVTGLISHDGVLLAFTATSVYSLADFAAPRPLSRGIGCIAPRSLAALADGTLVWLGRDGFYGLRPGEGIRRLSLPIDRLVQRGLNKARTRMAVAAVDAHSGEYRCAVAPAGVTRNTLILCFDGEGWRTLDLGYHVADLCVTADPQRTYTLFAGIDLTRYESSETTGKGVLLSDLAGGVWVMGHETADYDPPPRTYRYRSSWLRGSESARTPLNVRTVYLGMLDAYDGAATVRLYKNTAYAPAPDADEMTDLRLVGTGGEDDSGTTFEVAGDNLVADLAGSARVDTARFRTPRFFWRQAPCNLRDARTFAFEVEASWPARIHLAALAFDLSIASGGNAPAGRLPQRGDL